MIFAKKSSTKLVVGAAESTAEFEKFCGDVLLAGKFDADRASVMDMMIDDDFKGMKLPPLVIDFGNQDDLNKFIEENNITILKPNALVSHQQTMIDDEKEDPYAFAERTDDTSGRTIAEIHGLDTNDEWDKRTEEEKEADLAQKEIFEKAKKEGKLSGDSFSGGKSTARVTDVRTTSHSDGSVSIDNVLAVKGLYDNQEYGDTSKPEDYIFCVLKKHVYVTPKKFFAENGKLFEQSIQLNLPKGFNEVKDCVYELDEITEAEASDILLAMGVEEDSDFKDHIYKVYQKKSSREYNPDLLNVVKQIDDRMGGMIGAPNAVIPIKESYTVKTDTNPESIVLELFKAANIIPLDADYDDVAKIYTGIISEDAEGCSFGFTGTKDQIHRLIAVCEIVMNVEVEKNGKKVPFEYETSMIVDYDTSGNYYTKVEVSSEELANHYDFVDFIRVLFGTFEDGIANFGYDCKKEKWWIAFKNDTAFAHAEYEVSKTFVNHLGQDFSINREKDWDKFGIKLKKSKPIGIDVLYMLGLLPTESLSFPTRIENLITSSDGIDTETILFDFFGYEYEMMKLVRYLDMYSEECFVDGENIVINNEMCDYIDPHGIIGVYFRVDLKMSHENIQEFNSILKDVSTPAGSGIHDEGFWIAFSRQIQAESFMNHINDRYEAEWYGVNDKGERLVPKGSAEVVDPNASGDDNPRPWNARAGEYAALSDAERTEVDKTLTGAEFYYCGSYRGPGVGCVFYITPKSYFDEHQKPWQEPLEIDHLLPMDVKNIGGNTYQTKSRDWNSLSFDMARRGFSENLFFQLYLNSQ